MSRAFLNLFKPTHRLGAVDPLLAAVIVALLGFGVVMVFSASAIEATVTFKDPYYFLKRHGTYALLSLMILFLVSRIDYHRLKPLTYYGLGLVFFLLVLSVIGFGHSGGGAARWLRIGPIHIQPSELAKLGLVMWLAYSLAKKRDRVKSFVAGYTPHLVVAGGLMLLCLRQPDFGGAAVLLALTLGLLFVAGARLLHLGSTVTLGVLVAAWLVRSRDYRWDRVLAWRYMEEHRQSLAYQPFQSLMSFGSGETTGLGLGGGLQVLYLPEAHNDFIAAIIGEELGFAGILALCLVFLVIVARGVRIGLNAADHYGSYIAFGISLLFGIQALVNLAVAMALLPTKGLTLPFVSYGGSSLLVSATAAGILLNISRPRSALRENPARSGERAEASALMASQADFAPGRGRRRRPKEALA